MAAVLAYFTGIYGASLALLGDAVDSIGIALTPSPLSRFIYAVRVSECAAAGGGFVAVGDKDLAIYSAGGNSAAHPARLRQAGHYGGQHVCVYNRAGRLRVETAAARCSKTNLWRHPALR
ncbi:MAG: hypothetical protein ACLRZH_15990 [Ruthenibacterium lactatiformans]